VEKLGITEYIDSRHRKRLDPHFLRNAKRLINRWSILDRRQQTFFKLWSGGDREKVNQINSLSAAIERLKI
jgi:hypothetical protein